jgi:hypothetical protein
MLILYLLFAVAEAFSRRNLFFAWPRIYLFVPENSTFSDLLSMWLFKINEMKEASSNCSNFRSM